MTVHNWSGKRLPYRRKLLLLLLLAGMTPVTLLGAAAMLLHFWQVRPETDAAERIALKLLYGRLDEWIVHREGGTAIEARKDGSGAPEDVMRQLERDSGWKLFMTDGSGRERVEAYSDSDDVVYDGIRFIVHAQASAQPGWRYTVLIPQEPESPRTVGGGWKLPVVGGGCLLLCVVLIRHCFRSLYSPLRGVLERLKSEGKGKSPFSGGNELEALDLAFWRMDLEGRRLRAVLNEQRPFVYERLCRQLIHGEWDERSVQLLSGRFGHPPARLCFYTGIVCADDAERFAEHYGGNRLSVVHGLMREELERLCGPCLTLATAPGRLAVVHAAELGEEQAFERFYEALDRFRLYAVQQTRLVFSSAASDVGRSYEHIGEGYRETSRLLRYRLLLGGNRTITPEDVRLRSRLRMEETLLPRHGELIELLLQGEKGAAAEELTGWLELVRRSASGPEHALALVSAMLEELECRLEALGSRLDSYFAYDRYVWLDGIVSWCELSGWLRSSLLDTVVDHVEQAGLPRSKRIVRQVETYLKQHFEEPLGLQLTADRFGLTSSLLSRMFKETTGSSFSEYLLDIRMNKAMEWLAHTDWPLQHISDRLCYSTVQNFSRMFKKMAGMPPGEYRRHRQDERCTS